jgi:AhpD family alkylhydroperoxidase
MTLDYKFKTQLFWIVSRTNNCQYCMGHQESKLLNAGMTEDQIAALDFDWSQFDPAEQAAFAFARRFTYEPHRLTNAEIDALRKHYTDLQILEMILSMAGNNSINRWKEGVGVPQSASGGGFGRRTEGAAAETAPSAHSYLTPTAERFQKTTTKVAALVFDTSGHPTHLTAFNRPALESRAEVENAIDRCRTRTPRLPLVDDSTTLAMLPDGWNGPIPQWARLLANFPNSAKGRIARGTHRCRCERGCKTVRAARRRATH